MALELCTNSETQPIEDRCTDVANAVRLVEMHGERFKFVHELQRWIYWDGTIWAPDDYGRLVMLSKTVAESIFSEAKQAPDSDRRKLVKHAAYSGSNRGIKSMIELARAEEGMTMSQDVLDRHPMLLACANGTVDLETGTLRESSRRDRMTKHVPVRFDSTATCPRFLEFLCEILPDSETVRFLQRAIGYTITGSTREQCLFILHGAGANGKSVLLEILLDLFGSYGLRTASETLLAKRNETSTYDVAMLRGARLVVASETEDGRRMAESRVKELTGGDTVSARLPYGRPFTFRPVAKLWLATNHRPTIHGTDDAIWRRIRLVPFNRQFKGSACDPELPAKLRAELPGILAWAVRGAALWLKDGLAPPATVTRATEGYRGEQDELRDFLTDVCVRDPEGRVPAGDLYGRYADWCDRAGERRKTQRALGMALKARGYEQGRNERTRFWRGLKLKGGHDA